MVEGWSPCPQVDGHGLKSINGYVNKWGRQTFTAILMLLFIILLIKRRCSVRYVAWKMYFHVGGSWDENPTSCRNLT